MREGAGREGGRGGQVRSSYVAISAGPVRRVEPQDRACGNSNSNDNNIRRRGKTYI